MPDVEDSSVLRVRGHNWNYRGYDIYSTINQSAQAWFEPSQGQFHLGKFAWPVILPL